MERVWTLCSYFVFITSSIRMRGKNVIFNHSMAVNARWAGILETASILENANSPGIFACNIRLSLHRTVQNTNSTVASCSCSWLTGMEPNVAFCCWFCLKGHHVVHCERLFSPATVVESFYLHYCSIPVSSNQSGHSLPTLFHQLGISFRRTGCCAT